MKWMCSECGSKEIEQQSSVWVPMNDPDAEPTDWIFEDRYWCPNCDFECGVKMVEEDAKEGV